jgi:hypothetical protein
MDLREKMRIVMAALSTIQIEMLYLCGVPTQTDRRAATADPEEIREWLQAFVDLIIDLPRTADWPD